MLIEEKKDPRKNEFLLTEYIVLREEVLKRIEIRHQLISLALIAPGTIFAFGFQTQSVLLFLLYPFLALCLASSWSNNDHQIRLIGDYIDNHIESKIREDQLGWEHYRKSLMKRGFNLFFFGNRGIFIGTQVLAIIIAILIGKFNTITYVLLAASIVSVLLTVIVLLQHRITKIPSKVLIKTSSKEK